MSMWVVLRRGALYNVLCPQRGTSVPLHANSSFRYKAVGRDFRVLTNLAPLFGFRVYALFAMSYS